MSRFFLGVTGCMRLDLLLISSFATTLFSPFTAAAQNTGGQWENDAQLNGLATGDSFGRSLAGVGDVNGDGHPDLIIGAPYASRSGHEQIGVAYVISGNDHRPLWEFLGENGLDHFGVVSSAGDWNADGQLDFLIGAPDTNPGGKVNAGTVYVFSGSDGSLLWRKDATRTFNQLGSAVAGGGDMNGDGHADIVVGVTGSDPNGVQDAGSVHVYSGATGSRLLTFDGLVENERLGSALALPGDLNHDGTPDILVGAPGAEPNGWRNAGSAYLYSGASGVLLFRVSGDRPGDRLGSAVSGAGDVNGDGTPDYLVGAPDGPSGSGLQDAGYVKVVSGADGSLLYRLEGEDEFHRFGSSVAVLGDVDRDQFSDFLIGAQGTTQGLESLPGGAAYVYSGRTAALLHRQAGSAMGDRLGTSVTGPGDLDLDGFPDYAVGAPNADPNGRQTAGSVLIERFAPFLSLTSGSLSASSGTAVKAGIDFPFAEAGFSYALLASATGTGPTMLGDVAVPLTSDALLRAMLGGWAPGNVRDAFGALDANGDAIATLLSMPRLARFVGHTVFLAAVSYDPVGMDARRSSAYRALTIVP